MDDAQLDALADRLATHVLAAQPRPNRLLRYGETRRGALATAAVIAGAAIATGGVWRRVVNNIDSRPAERVYAQTIAVDRDRAHADVYYVDQRLRLLAMATHDDPEELVRGAARKLVAFVTAGRPADLRLVEVEDAYAPLREATDDEHPIATIMDLQVAYLDAWRRALS